MIACLSLYQENYGPLAALTLKENRTEYCDRWDHIADFREFPDMPGSPVPEIHRFLGFEKIRMILETFERHPQVSWAWFLDCDAMVTNMLVPAERVFSTIHQGTNGRTILLSSDCHGLNCGSMAVKNVPSAIALLKDVLAEASDPAMRHEQDVFNSFKSLPLVGAHVCGQKIMNSYDYGLYPDAKPAEGYGDQVREGQWAKGDFVIHWPGRTMGQRIEHYRQYAKEVVR